MAYAPGCEHDVFISYAHIDDEPLIKDEPGWVTALVDKLETLVRMKLGSKDLRVWMDDELAGNAPLTPALLDTLRSTATLVVIMSPGYLASPWCQRERATFLEVLRGHRDGGGRVFVVHRSPVERSALPAELSDLIGYPFWVSDRGKITRTLGTPVVSETEAEYWSRLNQLGCELADRLTQIKSSSETTPPPPSGPIVFLAEVTDDLDGRWHEVRSYLGQAGVQVLPDSYYPRDDPGAFEGRMRTDLQRCKLFVQLLSGVAGRKAPAAAQAYPALQHAIAHSTGMPILQWRSRDLDLGSVDDAGQRALLDEVTVRACGIEEFKQAIVEEARREPAPPGREAAAQNLLVFVNTDLPDRSLAQDVADRLLQRGVGYSMPLGQGSPDDIRFDLQENLRACDAVLFVYGSASPSWVRNQILQGRKIISQRDVPPKAIGILAGPPPKDSVGMALPGWLWIDCSHGTDLGPFFRSLG